MGVPVTTVAVDGACVGLDDGADVVGAGVSPEVG